MLIAVCDVLEEPSGVLGMCEVGRVDSLREGGIA